MHQCFVVRNSAMNIDLPGALCNDDEDPGFASSSDDNLSEHDHLDLGEGFALLTTDGMNILVAVVLMNTVLMANQKTSRTQMKKLSTNL
mmetsp:Transcript_18336/g.29163  ORF Transcript_18336/g.29163 Transcript_18336/m.29163 type:complete len:89 (-) Transcript_18336:149-415(-)